MAALLPCPFCGGDDILLDFEHPVYAGNGREFTAKCEDCGCEGPPAKDPRDGWNMRPDTKEGANLQRTTGQHLHGRDNTDLDLYDVCYWRKRANNTQQLKAEIAAILCMVQYYVTPDGIGVEGSVKLIDKLRQLSAV